MSLFSLSKPIRPSLCRHKQEKSHDTLRNGLGGRDIEEEEGKASLVSSGSGAKKIILPSSPHQLNKRDRNKKSLTEHFTTSGLQNQGLLCSLEMTIGIFCGSKVERGFGRGMEPLWHNTQIRTTRLYSGTAVDSWQLSLGCLGMNE